MLTPQEQHPQRCETCNDYPASDHQCEEMKGSIESSAAVFCMTARKGCASHTPAQQAQQRVVFSKQINVPSKAFPSVTRKKLAINEIDKDGEDGFIRVPFELQDGDIIQVVRAIALLREGERR